MTAITVFLTFLLLVIILAGCAWGGYHAHRKLVFLEAECGRLRLSAVEDYQQHEGQIQDLVLRLEAAEARLPGAAQRTFNSVNYTQRSQMLRMIRRGDPPEQISNTLGVPISQVKLLMKLPGSTTAPKGKGHVAGQSV